MGSFPPPPRSAVVVACVAAVVAAFALAIGVLGFQMTRTLMSVSSDPLRDIDVSVLPSQTPSTGIAGMIARGQRVNILLLGYGGIGHDGAFLTDSLMIASIDPRTGLVTLVSIPRDLWVTVPKNRYASAFEAKINAAFAIPAASGDRDEGMRTAALTVENVLGITIDRTVAIDFRAFRTVVDAIGGIDVTVDRSFTAMYPKNDDPSIDPSWIQIAFNAGPQHMDGETALRYTRARYSDGPEGDDFARAKRQQKVILAAKDRIVSSDAFTQLFGLTDALRDNVRTDLSLADMRALASFAKNYDDARTTKAALSTDNVLQAGFSQVTGYALWPKVEGWRDVRAYVERAMRYPSSLSEDVVVSVQVAAGRSGIGAAAARRLSDLGLRARVEHITTEAPAHTLIVDASRGTGETTARFLASYFGDVTLASSASQTSPRLDILLGRDWIPSTELAAPNESPTPDPGAAPSPPSPQPGTSPEPRASPPASPAPTSSVEPRRTPRPRGP